MERTRYRTYWGLPPARPPLLPCPPADPRENRAIIVSSVNSLQKATPHPDPTLLTAQFLRSPNPNSGVPIEVHVRTVKTGRGFKNLTADLYQSNILQVSAQLIYSRLPRLPNVHDPPSSSNMTLLPLTPSRYATISPLLTHPSLLPLHPIPASAEGGRRWSSNSIFDFQRTNRYKWCEDPAIKIRREGRGENGENESGVKLEWGAWFELNDEGEDLTSESLA